MKGTLVVECVQMTNIKGKRMIYVCIGEGQERAVMNVGESNFANVWKQLEDKERETEGSVSRGTKEGGTVINEFLKDHDDERLKKGVEELRIKKIK